MTLRLDSQIRKRRMLNRRTGISGPGSNPCLNLKCILIFSQSFTHVTALLRTIFLQILHRRRFHLLVFLNGLCALSITSSIKISGTLTIFFKSPSVEINATKLGETDYAYGAGDSLPFRHVRATVKLSVPDPSVAVYRVIYTLY